MRVLVTGVAGFIGSHTAGALLDRGDQVVGVDSFSRYYDRRTKEENVAAVRERGDLDFRELDLADWSLTELLEGVDAVVHLSAQPGVRSSWEHFDSHVIANVQVTQRLLEAAKTASLARFVYASSSSIYGQTRGGRSSEDNVPRPYSPYGVTKLAGEQLSTLYGENWNVSTISLRYFTVYGSRQRPDMLIHRVIVAAQHDRPLPLYGSGDQVRDFTHVSDVVAANLAALDSDAEPGTICNIGGGTSVAVREAIDLVEQITGQEVPLDRRGNAAGDVTELRGDISRARQVLGWQPEVPFRDGLSEQIAWHASRLSDKAKAI